MTETRWLAAALVAGATGLVGYELLALVLPVGLPWWVRDGLIAGAVMAVPVAVLHRWRQSSPGERAWAGPLIAGGGLLLAGHLLHVLGLAFDLTLGGGALPAPADVASLTAYPFLLAGLLMALRQQLLGIRLIVALDGLAGALAASAAATWAIAPLVDPLWNGSGASLVLLAYPMFDAVLLAAALGALGLVGHGHARQFGLWAVALLVLGIGDLAHAYRVALDTYVPGTWWEGLGALAVVLLALGATWQTAQSPQVPGARSLSVPALASLVAVLVLAGAPTWGEAPLPTVLALLTVAVCGARFLRAFLQLRELAVVREQAMTDELTGAANRRALYRHLDELLEPVVLPGRHAAGKDAKDRDPEDTQERADGSFAVALIDLNHFKEVNDTLGHAVGDALLKAVVQRFTAALEELETPHLLARLGGDEFAVVLHEATSRNAALIVGQALVESLSEPVQLPGTELHAHASIGLAVAPQHGRTRSEILFAADAAMYAAKTSGDAVRFHVPARDEKTQQLTVAEELYRALDRHELIVEYQPIVSTTGDLAGAEALLRWDHPEGERLEPALFLDAAERYRLTGAIAERVLHVALADLARWRASGVPLTVSVNLAAADLRDEAIVSVVANALLAHQVPAEALTLDIGEAALMENLDRAKGVVRALHDLGVRLALDDYGRGGISLETLRTLPFHDLKLDRTFARDAAVDARSGGIVRATIYLAHALGLRMVAEGVEDRRALKALETMGCDLAQGWHLGRPESAADFLERLSRPTGGKHRLPSLGQAPVKLPGQGSHAVRPA